MEWILLLLHGSYITASRSNLKEKKQFRNGGTIPINFVLASKLYPSILKSLFPVLIHHYEILTDDMMS